MKNGACYQYIKDNEECGAFSLKMLNVENCIISDFMQELMSTFRASWF